MYVIKKEKKHTYATVVGAQLIVRTYSITLWYHYGKYHGFHIVFRCERLLFRTTTTIVMFIIEVCLYNNNNNIRFGTRNVIIAT